MDIRKLQRVIVDGLEDVKAQNIVVFNTEHLSPLFERVIVASGTSNRQTKSLAASVREAVKAAGAPSPRVEGEENGEWIIVDCGAAVVHVMQPAIREYYHLEELWGEKPVKMKIMSVAPRLASASSSARHDDEPAGRAGDSRAPRQSTRGASASATAPTRKRSAATSPSGAASSRIATGKKSPARKSPARKSSAREATARNAPGKPRVQRTTGTQTSIRRPPAAKARGTTPTSSPRRPAKRATKSKT